jgi:hypothetical protein
MKTIALGMRVALDGKGGVMNKPVFEGKYCDRDCVYLSPHSICIAYSEVINKEGHIEDIGELWDPTRCPACISEHGLDGSQWSREAPTEPGWYPIVYADKDHKAVEVFQCGFDGFMVARFTDGVNRRVDECDLVRWGPRIEFPELPEGE